MFEYRRQDPRKNRKGRLLGRGTVKNQGRGMGQGEEGSGNANIPLSWRGRRRRGWKGRWNQAEGLESYALGLQDTVLGGLRE